MLQNIRLLYSEDHWAFTVTRVGEWSPLIYDGLRLSKIKEAAATFCVWLEEMYKLPDAPSPAFAESYSQDDSWSCGHRILSSWRYLLQTRLLQKPFSAPIAQYSIPEDVLCRSSFEDLSRVSLARVLMKSEEGAGVRPKLKLSSGIAHVQTSSAMKREREDEHGDVPPPVRQKTEIAVSVPATASAGALVHDDDGDAEDDDPGEPGHQPPSNKELKRAEKRGKAICNLQGLTNVKWQNCHRSGKKQVVQGHWQRFLQHRGGVPDAGVASCAECKAFLRKTEEAAAGDVALPQRYVPIPTTGNTKRGRPKKGEERKIDWRTWLQSERPNEYEIFAKDVETKTRQGPTRLEKDATHLRCLRCGGEFRVQRDTNMVALHLHESTKMHQRVVFPDRFEALVPLPVSSPCAGINLMSPEQTSPDSLCGQMRDGFLRLSRHDEQQDLSCD